MRDRNGVKTVVPRKRRVGPRKRFSEPKAKVEIDPRAKSAMWRVRRAIRMHRYARWSEDRARDALILEGLNEKVALERLRKDTAKREETLEKRRIAEAKRQEREDNKKARDVARAAKRKVK